MSQAPGNASWDGKDMKSRLRGDRRGSRRVVTTARTVGPHLREARPGGPDY